MSLMKNKIAPIAIAMPIALVVAYLMFRGTEQPIPKGAKPATESNLKYVETIKGWNNASFLPITSDSLRDLVSQVKTTGEALSAEQHDALRKSAAAFISAFHEPTPANFAAFRMPSTRYTFNDDAVGWLRERLARYYLTNGEAIPKQPVQVLNTIVPLQTEARRTKQYWSQLAPDQSLMAVSLVQKLPLPNFGEQVLSEENAGVIQYAPTVAFTTSPEGILATYGKVYLAHVRLLVRNVSQDPPFPVICQYYWDPQQMLWLPNQLATAYVGPRTGSPVF